MKSQKTRTANALARWRVLLAAVTVLALLAIVPVNAYAEEGADNTGTPVTVTDGGTAGSSAGTEGTDGTAGSSEGTGGTDGTCLLYTSPSPRD